MGRTFTDLSGDVIEIIDDDTSVEANSDIISGKKSQWFVVVGEVRHQVSEEVYNAVKDYVGA